MFSQAGRRSIFKFCVFKLAEAVRYLKFKRDQSLLLLAETV